MKSLAHVERVAAVPDKLCPDESQPEQNFLTHAIYEGHFREIHHQLRFQFAARHHGPGLFREHTDKPAFNQQPGRVRRVVNFHPQHGLTFVNEPAASAVRVESHRMIPAAGLTSSQASIGTRRRSRSTPGTSVLRS